MMSVTACERTEDADAAPGATSGVPTSPMAAASDEPDTGDDLGIASYCPPAERGYDALADYLVATDAKSAETGADGGGNVGAMNTHGQAMLAALAVVEAEWTEARVALDTEVDADIDDAFGTYLASIDLWAAPEAQIAATSSSINEYSLATLSLLATDGVTQAASEGAVALDAILVHTIDTCGLLPLPGA
jgi:hypothetical protein